MIRRFSKATQPAGSGNGEPRPNAGPYEIIVNERPSMEPAIFERYRRLIYDSSGITLRPGKEALVSARVGKRMRALGIKTHEDYLQRIADDGSGEEIVQLLDAISTNLTSFFREPDHFDFLTKTLTNLLDAGRDRIRLWSAACSTGEEPYSMAMTVLETCQDRSADIKILATDICTRVLQGCRNGVYAGDRLKTAPPVYRSRYFVKQGGAAAGKYAVRDDLKRMIAFRRLNLSAPPFPMSGPLDIVFCRNVMIYFDNTVRERLLREIYRLLRPGGFLIVGHSESLMGLQTEFQPVSASIYTR